ncbi:MAG: type II toxin-antitoxin system VapC family toxin [Caldilineaceae bacterium]
MARYLVDTNHLSPLVTIDHPLRTTVLRRMQDGDQFAVAAPALAEFLFGIQSVPRARRNMVEWNRLYPLFVFYHVDQSDAEQAATLQLELRRRGRQLHTVDALIAAVALRYDLTLLTTDKDFQAVPGLAQEDWIAPALS